MKKHTLSLVRLMILIEREPLVESLQSKKVNFVPNKIGTFINVEEDYFKEFKDILLKGALGENYDIAKEYLERCAGEYKETLTFKDIWSE